jgi:microcystin-dependent protein
MSDPFVGEIRVFGFNFAPINWATCSGQIMPLSQYTALFSLLGTTYGGNGQTNFALPNFPGYAPMHWGSGPGLTPRTIGETVGETQVAVITSALPQHVHAIQSANTTAAGQRTGTPGSGVVPGTSTPASAYIATGTPTPTQTFAPNMIGMGPVGGGQAHPNQQPLQYLTFCISLAGIFPLRS